MGVVGSRLAAKVPLTIASATGRVARTILRAEALGARPGFQQRAVDREMLARQQPFDLVLRRHPGQQLARHLALQQPVAVLGEGGSIPHRVLDAEPDKPGRSRFARPIAARSGSNRTPAAARRALAAPGGIDSRPIGEYSLANSPESDLSAPLTICRITR